MLASHLLNETAALLSELAILRSRSHAILAVASHKKARRIIPRGPEVITGSRSAEISTGPQAGHCADMVNDWLTRETPPGMANRTGLHPHRGGPGLQTGRGQGWRWRVKGSPSTPSCGVCLRGYSHLWTNQTDKLGLIGGLGARLTDMA